jgi:hypothetical protein
MPTKRKTPTKPQGEAQPAPAPIGGKLGLLVDLLCRPDGADVATLMAATGWQSHSVRGALAGALKKKRGLSITSQKGEGARIYRIVDAEAATDEKPAKGAKGRRAATAAQATEPPSDD